MSKNLWRNSLFRYGFLVLFYALGVLLLWVPSRGLMEAFGHFLIFRRYPLKPEGIPQTPAILSKKSSDLKYRLAVFRLLAPGAESVYVGGTFNRFQARQNPLVRRPDGLWEISLKLTPGRYLYKFKVDGRWELDPANPEKTQDSSPSSVLEIQ